MCSEQRAGRLRIAAYLSTLDGRNVPTLLQMTSDEIRRNFLEFFQESDHKRLPSASLIPSDPSVMFTIAGMIPLKPYFLGSERPPYPRMTTCKKPYPTVEIKQNGFTTLHNPY